jgi:RNA polymerase subunit RPABC4/transcription elongation factor Spt4
VLTCRTGVREGQGNSLMRCGFGVVGAKRGEPHQDGAVTGTTARGPDGKREDRKSNMQMKKVIISTIVIVSIGFLLDKLGAFRNPIMGAVIVVLICLIFPIIWNVRERIKKKYPDALIRKCSHCGAVVGDETDECPHCKKITEDMFTEYDEFAEDIKEKKVCPHCGLKELETVYEVGKGYREVCASCGKTRLSRHGIKMALGTLSMLILLALLVYWLFRLSAP